MRSGARSRYVVQKQVKELYYVIAMLTQDRKPDEITRRQPSIEIACDEGAGADSVLHRSLLSVLYGLASMTTFPRPIW